MTSSVKTARLSQEARLGLTFALLVSWSSLPLLAATGVISTRKANTLLNKTKFSSFQRCGMKMLPKRIHVNARINVNAMSERFERLSNRHAIHVLCWLIWKHFIQLKNRLVRLPKLFSRSLSVPQ